MAEISVRPLDRTQLRPRPADPPLPAKAGPVFTQATADGFRVVSAQLRYPARGRAAPSSWRVAVRALRLPPGSERTAESAAAADAAGADAAPDPADAELVGVYEVLAASGGVDSDTAPRAAVPTYVLAGKNIGRANATTAVAQAFLEAASLFVDRARKLATAPAATPAAAAPAAAPASAPAAPAAAPASAPAAEPAAAAAATTAGFDPRPLPQLIKPLAEKGGAALTPADFAAGVTVQPKLDGIRAVAYAAAGGVAIYSRTGIPLLGQDATAGAGLRAMFASVPAGFPPSPYLDGELYLHGTHLNAISGQARSAEAGSAPPLIFHIFDVFFPAGIAAGRQTSYIERKRLLDGWMSATDPAWAKAVADETAAAAATAAATAAAAAAATAAAAAGHMPVLTVATLFPFLARVGGIHVGSRAELTQVYETLLRAGFEGAVARRDSAGYAYGYNGHHTTGALKLKPRPDAEFEIVGWTVGSAGKAAGCLIWECAIPSGARFAVVPVGISDADRRALARCLAEIAAPSAAADGVPTTRFVRDILGLPLTVQYANLSPAGIPLQAKGLLIRVQDGSPRAAAVADLFKCAKIQ
jgi:ATP-dependent DNA ligase